MFVKSDHVTKQTVTQLRFKPSALGRHQSIGIGDGHQILNACREHRKRTTRARINEAFEFRCAANAADEIKAITRALVFNAEQRREHVVLQQRDIQFTHRRFAGGVAGPEGELAPLAIEVKTELILSGAFASAAFHDFKNGFQCR